MDDQHPHDPTLDGSGNDHPLPTSPLSPQGDDDLLPMDDSEDFDGVDGFSGTDPDILAALDGGDPAVDLDTDLGEAVAEAAASMLADRAAKEPVWPVSAYEASGLFGGSAQKLSDSFVAPLVAAARGYRTYDRSSIDSVFKDFNLGTKRTTQARRLMEAAIYKDVLLMPWFAVDEVYRSAARAEPLSASSIQYRPSAFLPSVDPEEKKRKYEFISGNATPLSMHPSTPGDWIDRSPTVLIAEGLLKADAALTGWLLSVGVARDQLDYDGTFDARLRLQRVMEMIPEESSLVICSIAGVWNWQQNPEWKMVSFNDRDVWLGIDGDVAVNAYVWKAAAAFKDFLEVKKRARVSMLSPQIPAESADGSTDEKIGIDDYLAEHGTWEQLLATALSPGLPARPADADAKKDDVRVGKDGCEVQQYRVVESDAAGNAIGGKWVSIVPMGGRIVATLAERIPSDAEIRTGEYKKDLDESQVEWEVEIEVKFKGVTDEPESHRITGPAKILNYLPEQWEAKGADIPAPILVHPDWPPRSKDGEAWLKAVKSNEPEKMIERVRWACMGWVPVPGSIPAFIAGDTVIGGNEDERTEVLPGVNNEVLDRASGFGVDVDLGVTFDDPDYRETVRQAIEAVLETYVRLGTWKDRRNASVIIASGLRPALPLPMKALPYYVGARGTGKTFSAEAAMAFWQATPSALIPVPGSAKDSAANMELALARSLIWTIDDLAPASSRRQSEDEKDKIGSLIRNYFNGTARGRATADMKSRKKNLPRAMLCITAENEPTVSSERDRVVLCDIGYGALSTSRHPTDELSAMIRQGGHANSQAPAKVAQAMVKYLRWCASQPQYGSWAALWERLRYDREAQTTGAHQYMQRNGTNGTKRHHDTAADLMISLKWLARLAEEVGCAEWVQDLLTDDGGMIDDIVDLIAEGQRANSETSPGRALLEALSATLRRQKAHIVLSDDPSAPPMVEDPNVCAALGWVRSPDGQTWRPAQGSDPIGWLMYDKKSGPFIMFDPKTAFTVAQTNFPGLIPHGQQERSSWQAVTGEKLGRVDLLRKEGTKSVNRARLMSKGVVRNGYPIDMDRVLRGGLEDAEYLSMDEADDA